MSPPDEKHVVYTKMSQCAPRLDLTLRTQCPPTLVSNHAGPCFCARRKNDSDPTMLIENGTRQI
jgi:hypothetical protein